MAQRRIVTIGRMFGSGGHDIGQLLAQQLGFGFYDKELLALAAKESGLAPEVFESNDERPTSSLLYTLSVGTHGIIPGAEVMPLGHQVFLAQFDTIRKLAQKENCVIVGRCADYALRSVPGVVNVFIHAPLEYRLARIQRRYGISESEARDRIAKTDKKRAAYHNSYSDHKWGAMETYHLTVDSSVLGTEGTAALIRQFLELQKEI